MPVRFGACLLAEFVGTFALCFIGILVLHSESELNAAAGLLAVALAHGLILGIMVTATMPTSGGHLNPAVTFGFLITGKIKPAAAVGYIVIQLLAGTIAALAVFALFGGGSIGQKVVLDGTPKINAEAFTAAQALLAEIIATFFLVFAVWGTAADPRAKKVGGFAIGLTVAADILAIGPITGGSMNPARSFGPTLVASSLPDSHLWATHWVYWVGPLLGASIAAIAYHLILWPRDPAHGVDPAAADVPATQQPK